MVQLAGSKKGNDFGFRLDISLIFRLLFENNSNITKQMVRLIIPITKFRVELMRMCWIAPLILLPLACGGSSKGGPTIPTATPLPTLVSSTIYPTSAILNQNGGTVGAVIRVYFTAPDGNLATLRIAEGGTSTDVPLVETTGETAGSTIANVSIDTTQLGSVTFSFQGVLTTGTTTNTLTQTFNVIPPAPQLVSLSPSTLIYGGSAFNLTLTGTTFEPTSQVLWNGAAVPTTFVSATTVTAQIPASALASMGTAQVTVSTPNYSPTAPLPFIISDGLSRMLAIPSNDIVWDSTNQVLYASLPSSAPSNGNSIAIINPVSGQVVSSTYVGNEPNRLAISDDDGCLYVFLAGSASVQRLLLPSLSPDLTIPLAAGSQVFDLQVAPGHPNTLAVVFGPDPTAAFGTTVTIFDGGTARPSSVSGFTTYDVSTIQWGMSTDTLYAGSWSDTDNNLYVLSVTANGATLAQTLQGEFAFGPEALHLDRTTGNLYSDSGSVINTATLAPMGIFGCSGPMATDATLGKAYFLNQSTLLSSSYSVASFNLNQFTPISSFAISTSYVPGSSSRIQPTRLLRWGSNGLATGGGGDSVYLINGPYVLGQ